MRPLGAALSSEYALEDLNGDGITDLAILSDHGDLGNALLVYTNLSDKQPQPTVSQLGGTPYRILARDVNKDGSRDLLIVFYDSQAKNLVMRVYANRGGAFQNLGDLPLFPTTVEVPEPDFVDLETGQIDTDGNLDVAVAARAGGDNFYVEAGGSANGTFTVQFAGFVNSLLNNLPISGITFADLNSDGIDDPIFTAANGSSSGIVRSFINDGTNYIQSLTFNVSTGVRKAFVNDYDGDGDLDIIAGTSGPTLRFRNFDAEIRAGGTGARLTADQPYAEFSDITHLAAVSPRGVLGANVSLQNSGGAVFNARTDKDGIFIARGLPAGSYTVTARLSGFQQITPTQVNFGGTPVGVNIIMRKTTPDNPPPPASPAQNQTNDTGFLHLWGLFNYGQFGGTPSVDVDALEAWNFGKGSSDVVVGVVDTGIDQRHEDIAANIWINRGEIPDNGVDDDANGYIDDVYGYDFANQRGRSTDLFQGHGTHVAGTIGAVGNNSNGVSGVNQQVKLMAVKVFPEFGGAPLTAIFNGLSYIVTMKIRGVNVRVINLSLGGTRECDQGYKDAFSALDRAGVLVIVAAGNDGKNNDVVPSSPANCRLPNVISVAAIDRLGNLASFSNFGPTTVDIAAPGVEILSTWPDQAYQFLDGTSMAAPHVTGVAALLFSIEPTLTPAQARQRLLSTAKPLAQLLGRIAAPGIVSAGRAIAAGRATPPPGGTPSPGPGPSGIIPPVIGDATVKLTSNKSKNTIRIDVVVKATDPDGEVKSVNLEARILNKRVRAVLKQSAQNEYKGKATLKRPTNLKGKQAQAAKVLKVLLRATDNQDNATSVERSYKVK